ncbi:MAG TPA: lipoate--protein ligase family protein, partial [Pirellulales bacterium]|nr:lipoate--protein ligase family protein [Pirellulales bacterium]
MDLTLPTPEQNLALDEALLDEAETAREPCEILRLWESPQPIVVLGRGSQVSREVNLSVCHDRRIRIVRRTSGGAAVVVGPGCLMYAVVLSYNARPPLRAIERAHDFVLNTVAGAVRQQVGDVRRRGTSDLALI